MALKATSLSQASTGMLINPCTAIVRAEYINMREKELILTQLEETNDHYNTNNCKTVRCKPT